MEIAGPGNHTRCAARIGPAGSGAFRRFCGRLCAVRDAVICEPLRTAVGGFGGVLRDVPPAELAATVIREVVRRSSLPPDQIYDVLLGQCYPNGEAPAIGRVAALDAGLPVEVPGLP